MKRLIMITCILTACCTVARPGPFRPAPPSRHFHHLPHSYYHYYHTYVSPLTVFTVGTFVGAVIANTDSKTIVVQQPTVIQRPVVTVCLLYSSQLSYRGQLSLCLLYSSQCKSGCQDTTKTSFKQMALKCASGCKDIMKCDENEFALE